MRSILMALILCVASGVSGQNVAPQRQGGQSEPDVHAAGVDIRGDHAMGFSHGSTAHHFILLPYGGVIVVVTRSDDDKATSHYGASQGGSRHSRFQKLTPEAVRRVEICDGSAAMTLVTLELCARYGAWFRCAGDLRCGGGWRQLDPVGEFSKPMAPGPRSSIPCRRRFDG